MSPAPRPLPFTFGNHMHWVDMQWLWGYRVLPDSVDDMLALCAEVGARGNVNFDGVGYERLAAEAPDALARLRDAVAAGTVEVVGASYGQPYGLFCGGESNVRQRTYGARAVRRHLGVWPRTFWEEEFDFFPQLPQILAGAGFTGASLFFQWTWHTPHVPEEDVAVVLWEGIDGTRLPAAARTALCLHQWPEDFDGKLERAVEAERPALVQWLELMPSPDWMCRSEVLLPRLRELFADPRFDVRPTTLGELVASWDGDAPVRAYSMDDVFHGVSLGKNGDRMRRLNRRAEDGVLAAEAAAATVGLVGRPYASWSVYPTWELEEAWRELLQAQHHDNDECEGLCGSVGARSYERSIGLSGDVLDRTLRLLARRAAPAGARLHFNPLGWPRRVGAIEVPAFGWAVAPAEEPPAPPAVRRAADHVELEAHGLRARVDLQRGTLEQLWSDEFPDGALARPLVDLAMDVGGRTERFGDVELVDPAPYGAALALARRGEAGALVVAVGLAGDPPRVELRVVAPRPLARPNPAFHAGLRMPLAPSFDAALVHDTPYAVDGVRAEDDHVRKYPSGDWMTSEQVFETIRRPFTALSFVDLVDGTGERGLLWVHDGSQALHRDGDAVVQVLSMYDAWDEDGWIGALDARFRLAPHGPLSHADRWKRAQEWRRPVLSAPGAATAVSAPPRFGALDVAPDHVAATALFRECPRSAEHVEGRFASEGEHPFVVRLVELDGRPADVRLRVPGPCARAARTDLLGAVVEPLDVGRAEAVAGAPADLGWSAVRLALRPREVATVMLDLELGRHVPRNLDDHRHVWATVHRREGA